MGLWVQDTFTEVTITDTEEAGYNERNIILGDSEPYETYHDSLGSLYRGMIKEYGRCTGKVYADRKDGSTIHVGWVFRKRVKYDDCDDTYLRDVWVTVVEPVVTHCEHCGSNLGHAEIDLRGIKTDKVA